MKPYVFSDVLSFRCRCFIWHRVAAAFCCFFLSRGGSGGGVGFGKWWTRLLASLSAAVLNHEPCGRTDKTRLTSLFRFLSFTTGPGCGRFSGKLHVQEANQTSTRTLKRHPVFSRCLMEYRAPAVWFPRLSQRGVGGGGGLPPLGGNLLRSCEEPPSFSPPRPLSGSIVPDRLRPRVSSSLRP